MTTTTGHRARRSDRARSWWSLALLPVAFVAAFVVGEGLFALYGYEVHGEQAPPWWAVAGAALPALAVFAVPMALALHFGRRALLAGDEGAKLPMAIGVAVTAVFVLQNTLAFLVGG